MRRLGVALVLLAAACATSSTDTGGTTSESKVPKVHHDDLGCLTDLGSAENTYNDTVQGIKDGTLTDDDAAKAFEKVKSKLDDLAVVNSEATIKSHAHIGAVHAGRLRVALLGGGSVDASDATILRQQLDALDSACQAAS